MALPGAGRRSRVRPGLLVGLGLLAVALAACQSSQSSYVYRWDYFTRSVFSPDSQILSGLGLTLGISITAQLIGVVLGVFGALGRMSRIGPLRWLTNFYVWFFRGTPLLVQITFIYFGLGVAGIWAWDRHPIFGVISGGIQAGVVALGLNEGAYMTEIVRAGILSIDPGQMEAAKSLGMPFGLAMRRIVLPQAARVIVPPLGNEFNNMLKTTSLLVIISVPELYVIFSRKNGTAFAPFELFLAAAVWYLLLTTIWSIIQARIERRFARGTGTAAEASVPLRDRLIGSRFGSSGTGLR